MHITMPAAVCRILEELENAGYEAYAVGGCVRDALLSRVPEDWDITTSASPQQVKALFRHTVDTGIAHGTVTVLMEHCGYEVTTYRLDGEYEDHRHPKEVVFTASLAEDLRRRDFTINAMAYNEHAGLVDLFGGQEDLKHGMIRCVGNAMERFSEDALRIFRAIRFSGQLGFAIEEQTMQAMKVLAPDLKRVSAERIRVELMKLLLSPHPERLLLARTLGITGVVFPEWDVMLDTAQNNPNHHLSVGEHTLLAIQNLQGSEEYQAYEKKEQQMLSLAMLLHDVAKPSCMTEDSDGTRHFYEHPQAGEQMAKAFLKRLRFDNDTLFVVTRLVRYHDTRCEADEPENMRRQMRRMMNKIGTEYLPMLFLVQRADILAQSMYHREEKLARLACMKQVYAEICTAEECVSLKTLAVTGKDLIAAGFQSGPALGDVLNRLLQEVLAEPERNQKEQLLAMAEAWKDSEKSR